ncbi:MAG: AAA family ATPase, partial [Pseudomonadales bacterium]|nr:AAA family ATPase [Pseudomonadales bacterium]NIQ90835.1 AAA family ATPase [Deltaproteobacteria bacterium]NIX07527.1 AAA family ATPase [Pseudomonadales bacterium]
MIAPLLKTKFYVPPPRPNLVSRPRLIQRLDRGLRLGHRITLVSAPAGFGKTTLLSEWIASSERPVAWVSLDEGDNDAVRFLTYLVGALQGVDEAIGQSVEGILQSPQLPSAETAPTDRAVWVEAPTAALIGDVTAASTALVLVLDDYHLISAAPVHH